MVVLQIDIDGIGGIPSEGDPPASGDADRPTALAMRGVKKISRQIQLLGARGRVQDPQYATDPTHVLHVQTAHAATLEIGAKRLAAKAPNHETIRSVADRALSSIALRSIGRAHFGLPLDFFGM
jgi:hypothetical protein